MPSSGSARRAPRPPPERVSQWPVAQAGAGFAPPAPGAGVTARPPLPVAPPAGAAGAAGGAGGAGGGAGAAAPANGVTVRKRALVVPAVHETVPPTPAARWPA